MGNLHCCRVKTSLPYVIKHNICFFLIFDFMFNHWWSKRLHDLWFLHIFCCKKVVFIWIKFYWLSIIQIIFDLVFGYHFFFMFVCLCFVSIHVMLNHIMSRFVNFIILNKCSFKKIFCMLKTTKIYIFIFF